ncbi:MAG: class I SAM-dependent methyltransferase [Acidobacteriota bacterium]
MPNTAAHLPGDHLDIAKMPGHWFLARMGKRVLRPGGRALTDFLLAELSIGRGDAVVEMAPGLGVTTRLALAAGPSSYTVVERDSAAAATLESLLSGVSGHCLTGDAADTQLPPGEASVVFGEAFLTMQPAAQKKKILEEAFRLLRPGGRYGFHELGLCPDSLSEEEQTAIQKDLAGSIRVGARPLTCESWRDLITSVGFEIQSVKELPMELLGPRRLVRDEGLLGAARIAFNALKSPKARARMRSLRATFRRNASNLRAIAIVARKPA